MSFRYIIADDAPFMREIVKTALNKVHGVCVGEATNGEECLTLIRNTQPDFLFLDLVMPKLNGIECGAKVSEEFPAIQIILFSTLDPSEIQSKLNKIRYKHYITKPFTKEDLIASIS